MMVFLSIMAIVILLMFFIISKRGDKIIDLEDKNSLLTVQLNDQKALNKIDNATSNELIKAQSEMLTQIKKEIVDLKSARKVVKEDVEFLNKGRVKPSIPGDTYQ